MNKNTLLPFVDVGFNISLFMVLLIVLLIVMINPKKQTGVIETKDTFILTMTWNDTVSHDVDIHIKNPIGDVINFLEGNRDKPWGTLERDDLGTENDYNYIDESFVPVKYNREVIHLRNPIDGHYIVNAHMYTLRPFDADKPQNITIEFIQLDPTYRVLYTHQYPIKLQNKEEYTLFSFDLQEKRVNINTLEQVPFVLQEIKRRTGR